MVLKLKDTAQTTGNGAPDWYLHDTENLAGVTNAPINEAIGLSNVLVFAPTTAQASNGMVASIILKTVVGDIRGSVYESKTAPGTMYFRPPQSKEENAETGVPKWHDEVSLTSKIRAQVLRYIHTQVEVSEAQPVTQEQSASSAPFSNLGSTSNTGNVAGTVAGVQGQTQVQGQVTNPPFQFPNQQPAQTGNQQQVQQNPGTQGANPFPQNPQQFPSA